MDKRTQYMLNKIGRSIPKEMLNGGMKTVKDDGELHARMAWAAKKLGRKDLQQAVDAGMFREPDRQVVDEQGAQRIESHVEGEVAKLLSSGVIKPAEQDSFTRQLAKS